MLSIFPLALHIAGHFREAAHTSALPRAFQGCFAGLAFALVAHFMVAEAGNVLEVPALAGAHFGSHTRTVYLGETGNVPAVLLGHARFGTIDGQALVGDVHIAEHESVELGLDLLLALLYGRTVLRDGLALLSFGIAGSEGHSRAKSEAQEKLAKHEGSP